MSDVAESGGDGMGENRGGWATARWLADRQSAENAVALGLALLVGGATGLGIVIFRKLIVWMQMDVFGLLGRYLATTVGDWAVLFVPAIGGLVVGLVVRYGLAHDRYPGVAGVMEATALAGGRLEYWLAPAKTAAAVVSIGAGASVGPEDPSVQIGANLGAAVAHWLRQTERRTRLLVAAGAAGGIAAAFNAPIAGIFFALEIVLGQFTADALGIVMLAAVAASVVAQAGLGTQPAFVVPAYQLRSGYELPLYMGLGVMAAVVAAAYIRALAGFEVHLRRSGLPRPLLTMAGGLVIGVVGLWVPQVLGVGYDTIGSFLQGQVVGVRLLLLLLIAKLIVTPFSLGSGFVGGVFAPSLFLGAMLGGAYGTVLHQALPGVTAVPAAYAMVGMAAVLAATVRAPLTAILISFEMTRDYRIILPLIAAVGVAMIVAAPLQPDGVYTAALRRRGVKLGIRLAQLTGAEVMQVTVAEGAPAVGRTLAELKLPAGWVVAAVHRGQEVEVPQGSTRLQAGDRLVVVVQGDQAAEIPGCFVAATSTGGGESRTVSCGLYPSNPLDAKHRNEQNRV